MEKIACILEEYNKRNNIDYIRVEKFINGNDELQCYFTEEGINKNSIDIIAKEYVRKIKEENYIIFYSNRCSLKRIIEDELLIKNKNKISFFIINVYNTYIQIIKRYLVRVDKEYYLSYTDTNIYNNLIILKVEKNNNYYKTKEYVSLEFYNKIYQNTDNYNIRNNKYFKLIDLIFNGKLKNIKKLEEKHYYDYDKIIIDVLKSVNC